MNVLRRAIRRLVLWAVPEADPAMDDNGVVFVVGDAYSGITPRAAAERVRERIRQAFEKDGN